MALGSAHYAGHVILSQARWQHQLGALVNNTETVSLKLNDSIVTNYTATVNGALIAQIKDNCNLYVALNSAYVQTQVRRVIITCAKLERTSIKSVCHNREVCNLRKCFQIAAYCVIISNCAIRETLAFTWENCGDDVENLERSRVRYEKVCHNYCWDFTISAEFDQFN